MSDDNIDVSQQGLLDSERETARRRLARNQPTVYCVGPGWKPKLIRSLEEFDFYQSLSVRGVPHVSVGD